MDAGNRTEIAFVGGQNEPDFTGKEESILFKDLATPVYKINEYDVMMLERKNREFLTFCFLLSLLLLLLLLLFLINNDFLKHKQANINVKSRRFGVIVTPFSRQSE